MGDAVLDVTVQPAAALLPGGDVPAVIRIGPGGQGANLAVRLARQGMNVRLICGLGDDAAGAFVSDALERERVTLTPVRVAETPTVVILLDARGERTMLSQRAPFVARAGPHPPGAAAWVVVSGYLLLEAEASQLARLVLAAADHRAVVGCAIPLGRESAWLESAAAVRPSLVILNRDEAEALALEHGHPAGPGTGLDASLLVVTDATGAVAWLDDLTVSVTAPSGGPASDTTGAGDAFAAAFVASLSTIVWPPPRVAIESALDAAVRIASAVAGVSGAQGLVSGERAAGVNR